MNSKSPERVDWLLQQFDAAGITLQVRGNQLNIDGPPCAVTGEMQNHAKFFRVEILLARCGRISKARSVSGDEAEWRRQIRPFDDTLADGRGLVVPYGSLTDFPELFDPDWASFDAMELNSIGRTELPSIIRNRNHFAGEFELTCACTCTELRQAFVSFGMLDEYEIGHAEAYCTRGGSVVLVSTNYDESPPPVLGMREVPTLWYLASRTYVCVCQTLEDAIRLCQRIPGKPSQE